MRHLGATVILLVLGAPAFAQSGGPAQTPPPTYGTLTQNDLALRLRNEDIDIRFVPLDPRVTRLLARDAFRALRTVVETRRREIDSVASQAGVSRPGLALVSFYGLRSGARFDPQTVTLLIRSRVFRPLGVIPINTLFTSQQLDVREQASAIYVFEEDIPVEDSFSLAYGALVSEDWQTKQPTLDRERARVSARARAAPRDTAREHKPGER